MTLSAGIPCITVAQMQEADKIASVELGITVHMLMENASAAVAEMAREMLGGNCAGKSVVVLAGRGNNGGDGLGAARHLMNFGCTVKCILTSAPDELKPAVYDQYNILQNLCMDIIQFTDETSLTVKEVIDSSDLVIDALLGLDLKGDPRWPVSSLIDLANESEKPILAVDIPSGLDADAGKPSPHCIRAASSLTLALPKPALMFPAAKAYTGELFLADISLPNTVFKKIGVSVDESLFSESNIIKISI